VFEVESVEEVAGMEMMGMVKLESNGVRDGWKVMFERSMAASDDKVAVCVCGIGCNQKRMIQGKRGQCNYSVGVTVGERKRSQELTAVKETRNAKKSSSTKCLATRILSLKLTSEEKASCAIIYKVAKYDIAR
jgi:Tfp pilus assembly PilM family ATPase